MTYYRSMGAINLRSEGGSGDGPAGGGLSPGPRRRLPLVTGALTPRPGRVRRPLGPIAPVKGLVIAPAPATTLPPGLGPKPAIISTPAATLPPGLGPKPATYSGGGGGGGGGGDAEFDSVEVIPDQPAPAPKSRLGLYLLIGAGAIAGYSFLRRRK